MRKYRMDFLNGAAQSCYRRLSEATEDTKTLQLGVQVGLRSLVRCGADVMKAIFGVCS